MWQLHHPYTPSTDSLPAPHFLCPPIRTRNVVWPTSILRPPHPLLLLPHTRTTECGLRGTPPLAHSHTHSAFVWSSPCGNSTTRTLHPSPSASPPLCGAPRCWFASSLGHSTTHTQHSVVSSRLLRGGAATVLCVCGGGGRACMCVRVCVSARAVHAGIKPSSPMPPYRGSVPWSCSGAQPHTGTQSCCIIHSYVHTCCGAWRCTAVTPRSHTKRHQHNSIVLHMCIVSHTRTCFCAWRRTAVSPTQPRRRAVGPGAGGGWWPGGCLGAGGRGLQAGGGDVRFVRSSSPGSWVGGRQGHPT